MYIYISMNSRVYNLAAAVAVAGVYLQAYGAPLAAREMPLLREKQLRSGAIERLALGHLLKYFYLIIVI